MIPLSRSLLCLLLCAGASQALAQQCTPEEGMGVLFVSLTRNQVPVQDTILELDHVCREGELDVLARSSELISAGLDLSTQHASSEWVSLDELPGLQYELDTSAQHIELLVDVKYLTVRHQFQDTRAQHALSPTVRGVALDYDISFQSVESNTQGSVWGQLRTLGGPGQFTQSWRSSTSSYDVPAGHVRLDSAWTWEDPEKMVFATVGDTVSSSTSWSRSMRFAGIQVGRDFSLQPYRLTSPSLIVSSSAALPSSLEVLIDGVQTQNRDVLPGLFDLSVPLPSTGASTVQVILTDINGQSRPQNIPVYGSSQLLEKSLWSGSTQAGYLREDYGLSSNSYDDEPFVSASGRYGVNSHLTMEGNFQHRDGLSVVGVGGVGLLPAQLGQLNASYSLRSGGDQPSFSAEGSPHQYSLGWTRQSRSWSVGASSTRRGGGFYDIVSYKEGFPLPLRSEQAWLTSSTKSGQWGVGYINQANPGIFRNQEITSKIAHISWSHMISGVSVSANIQRDLTREENSAFVSFSIPFPGNNRAQVSRVRRPHGSRTSLAWSSPIVGEQDDWGWRAGVSLSDDNRIENSWAQITRQNSALEYSVGLTRHAQQTSAWGQGHGSLLYLPQSGLTFSRQSHSSFALVSTGLPNVPVKLENRPVGRTDEKGLLFVDRLQPWQANRISIDTRALPADIVLDSQHEVFAVPRQSQGAVVEFDMYRALSFQGQIQSAGSPVPAGATWEMFSSEKSLGKGLVGNDGFVWISATQAGESLVVSTTQGVCHVQLPSTVADEMGFTDLGVLSCLYPETP